MTNKHIGRMLGISAFGMMLGLMSVDFVQMKSLNEISTPVFIGNIMAHISNVILAFVSGKLLPTWPHNQRETDRE